MHTTWVHKKVMHQWYCVSFSMNLISLILTVIFHRTPHRVANIWRHPSRILYLNIAEVALPHRDRDIENWTWTLAIGHCTFLGLTERETFFDLHNAYHCASCIPAQWNFQRAHWNVHWMPLFDLSSFSELNI